MDIRKILNNFEQNGFAVHSFDNREQLLDHLKASVPVSATAGFGGSSTLRELGIPETLKAMGVTTFDHWEPDLSPEDLLRYRLEQGRADWFFTSVNAATENGRLVLVDGVGNRVAAAVYGPGKVVYVFGTNKIRESVHAAFERVKTIAGPMRAKSLNMKTPCIKTGVCEDCDSPQRICRAKLIVDRAPFSTPSEVWLIDGNWGY
jgi:LUD domain